jgi:hypothetical protein
MMASSQYARYRQESAAVARPAEELVAASSARTEELVSIVQDLRRPTAMRIGEAA